MKKIFVFLLCVLSTLSLYGQDERLLRQMLSGQLLEDKFEQKEDLKFTATGPRYYFDLNGDYREESFYFTKEDGEDWLYLYDFRGKEVYRYRFVPMGSGSRVYRVTVKWVSKDISVAIIHYFEGKTAYLEKRGTARLYFLSFKRGELADFNMFRGPHVWDEFKDYRGQYHRRSYKVSLYDFDKDGRREISVKYHTISRVYRFAKDGKWYSYPENPKKIGLDRF